MTWNMWFGGTNVNGYRAKQRRQIEQHRARRDHAPGVVRRAGSAAGQAPRLGLLPGQLVARDHHPPPDRRARSGPSSSGGPWPPGVRIRLPDDTEVVVWTAHLAYDPYGPYDACFDGMTPAELLEREHEAGRPQQMRAILAAMADDLAAADDAPVLLTGDFNAPSHLDWVPAASDLHCGYQRVVWPTTKLAEEAGLTDAYRVVHPDPVATPGTTWSPIYPRHHGSTGAHGAAGPDRLRAVRRGRPLGRLARAATSPAIPRRTASTRTTDGPPTTRR